MQFKNPEILYFLFLLIIPILVHLFQLRRFRKEYFTNVRFLRELSIQTRKSSKLKKYLLLATRMLLLAATIIAFAQPFFAAKQTGAANELYIVLDNSFSMQARGKQGELLRRSVEDLLASVPEGRTFSLLTNDDAFWDTNIKSIRSDLQQLPYSALPFDLESQMARINTRKGPARDIVIITDAAGIRPGAAKSIDSLATVRFIVPKAEQKSNVSIDSVYVEGVTGEFYDIAVRLKAESANDAVPVALHDRGKLVAKTMAGSIGTGKTIRLTLPKTGFHGYASITDNGMAFDNRYYFSITAPKKTKVISVGSASKANFMQRIYTDDEFQYANYELRSLDYNLLPAQDAVIVNELEEVPGALQSTLQGFANAGGTVIVIPPAKGAANINQLLEKIGAARLGAPSRTTRQVTRISFSHPLFAQVFEKKIDNFQYPSVNVSYALSSRTAPALSFEGGEPFLSSSGRGLGNAYVFAAPLSREYGNFQLSPLIVPAFYNMARSSSIGGLQAVEIGDDAPMLIDAETTAEGVLEVRGNEEKFIPLQQLQGGKARLTFADNPTSAGNFEVFQNSRPIAPISFNYDRSESFPQTELGALSGFEVAENAGAVFDELTSARTGTEIWKWFVILALLFAVCELLIQKFVK